MLLSWWRPPWPPVPRGRSRPTVLDTREVLIDIDDVTLGSKKRARLTDPDQVVTSVEHAQEPLVDQEIFDAVRERLAGGVHAPVRRQRATPHPYVLRGLITCARCGRRMQGSWRQTRAYYQCRLADPAEYARSRELEADHPRSAYVREDRITTHIDTWLAQLFDPNHIEHTIAELTQPFADDPVPPRAEVLRRTIAQMDRKLDRYREALEAGTNPALIATWTAEVESARAAAETELAGLGPASPRPIENIPALIADIRQEWGTIAGVAPIRLVRAPTRNVGTYVERVPGRTRRSSGSWHVHTWAAHS